MAPARLGAPLADPQSTSLIGRVQSPPRREVTLQIALPSAPRRPRSPSATNSRRRERVASAILVLVVAAALRLPFPDLTPFGHDEALEAARARPIWYGARPVESEITSWWIPDPAGLLYFFALAEAFPSPALARVELVALANLAAVMLTYLLARRFFGAGVGLAAGLLYAVNPWAVTFGRQAWVIIQPLLTTLMLLAAMMVCVRRDRRWVVPFFVVGAAQTQTHLLAVLYGPPVLLTLILFARRWLGRELAVAAALAALVAAPYTLHLWGRFDEIVEALVRGNRGLTLAPDPAASTLTVWLVGGAHLDAKLGFQAPALEALRAPVLAVTALLATLLVAGIVISARASVRRQSGWEAHALLLIWCLAPLAAMTWQSSAVYIHYVLVLLPTPFLLVAVALRDRWARFVLATVCALHVATLAAFYGALEASLAVPRDGITPTEWQARLNRVELVAKQAGFGELHGLPLRYWQSVADRTRAAASGLPPVDQGTPRDMVAITGIQDDGNRHLDRRRKALEYLLGPDLEARFPLEGLTVLPSARDTLVLAIPEQDLPRAAARDATRLAEAPLPGTNGATRLWLVRARPPRDLVQPRTRAALELEGGTHLLGLDAPPRAQAGQTISLISYWLVERDNPRPGSDDEPFLELLDADGRPRAYQARGGLPSAQWRAGDVLVQRGSLTLPPGLPPGDYRLVAGLVSRVDGTRARVSTGVAAAPVASVSVRGNP